MTHKAQICDKKHVLHVIDALTYGGAQELVALIAKWTPSERFKTTVCALQPNPELKARIDSYGVRVLCFCRERPSVLEPHRFASYFLRNVWDIVRLCRQDRVNVIQCHLSDAEFIGIFAGFLAGVQRIITTLHYPDLLPSRRPGDLRNLLRRLVTRALYRWTDAVVAVSDDVAGKIKDFIPIDPAKVHTIVNRIDVDSFRKISAPPILAEELRLEPGQKVVLTVARLMPPKGHAYLIDAVGRLKTVFPKIRLLLVGDGDLRPELTNRCASLGLLDSVQFLGSRSDVAEILSLADVFVLPSLWEGTSLALLEAMAAGKPIVATDIPGNMAVLGPENGGLLVPPGDSAALADAICYMLNDGKAAGEYGKRADRIAKERFDVRKSIAQLELLWVPKVTVPFVPQTECARTLTHFR